MSKDTDLNLIVEAALLASGRPLKVDELVALFTDSAMAVDRAAVRIALREIGEALEARSVELVEVASGYRIQVRAAYAAWISGLWTDRPPRYSRALLETLALIAYRQPATRGEIEDIRGVSVSASIMKTLQEREWVRVLGHREVPGRPALYGTTKTFLDDFNLRGLEDLPPLADVRDIDRFHGDLFPDTGAAKAAAGEGTQATDAAEEAADDTTGQDTTGSTDADGNTTNNDARKTDVAGSEDSEHAALPAVVCVNAEGETITTEGESEPTESVTDAQSTAEGDSEPESDLCEDGPESTGDATAAAAVEGDGTGSAPDLSDSKVPGHAATATDVLLDDNGESGLDGDMTSVGESGPGVPDTEASLSGAPQMAAQPDARESEAEDPVAQTTSAKTIGADNARSDRADDEEARDEAGRDEESGDFGPSGVNPKEQSSDDVGADEPPEIPKNADDNSDGGTRPL
jgi:segregation and condensation protein B